jgi:glutamyl/glutaminyl-tRNA synthetase
MYLEKARDLLADIPDTEFTVTSVKDAVWDYASKIGRGNVLWPTRFALSGQKQSPGPFMIAAAIGKKETTERLNTAVSKLKNDN